MRKRYKENRLTDDLMNEWMKQLKNKRAEYASFLVNKIEEGNKKKGARPTAGHRMSMARGIFFIFESRNKFL